MINLDLIKMLIEKMSSNDTVFSKMSFEDLLNESLFIYSNNSCIEIDTLIHERVGYFVNIIICNANCGNNGEIAFRKKISGYSFKWAIKIRLKDTDLYKRIVDILSRNSSDDRDELTCYWAVYESGCDAKRETPQFISVLFVDGEPHGVFSKLYASKSIGPSFVFLDTSSRSTDFEANKKGSRLFKAIEKAKHMRRPWVICKGCDLEWDGYEKQDERTSGDLTLWGDNRTYFVHDEVQLSTTKINIICKYKNNDSN